MARKIRTAYDISSTLLVGGLATLNGGTALPAGDIGTADIANGAVSLNEKLGLVPFCRIENTTDQSFSNNTRDIQGFDTEINDYASQPMHFTSNANLTGTVTKTATQTTLAGTGTSFTTELSVGQVIIVPGTANEQRTVTAIASNTSLTVNKAWVNTASGQTAVRTRNAIALPYAGLWRIETQLLWDTNGTGNRTMQICKNGFGSGSGGTYITTQAWIPNTVSLVQSPAYGWYEGVFDAWDNVDIRAIQTSGSNLLSLGSAGTFLQLPYLQAAYRGRVA